MTKDFSKVIYEYELLITLKAFPDQYCSQFSKALQKNPKTRFSTLICVTNIYWRPSMEALVTVSSISKAVNQTQFIWVWEYSLIHSHTPSLWINSSTRVQPPTNLFRNDAHPSLNLLFLQVYGDESKFHLAHYYWNATDN